MRDPYDILGVPRGASFEDIRAGYRRASKKRHPDMGGSHEAMVELNAAYASILNELKHGYQQREEQAREASDEQRHTASSRGAYDWKKAYRDIDDELEELHREAERQEMRQRAMRADAWATGNRVTWAKLTWHDFVRFIRNVARSGLKGITLLFAALVGVGSVLVEANVISALIILGSGIGFLLFVGLKNGGRGVIRAGLVVFGIIIGLHMIGVTISNTQRQVRVATRAQTPDPAAQNTDDAKASVSQPPQQSSTALRTQPEPSQPPPEIRTLIASQGAVLKFVAGVDYRIKVRTGYTTSIRATRGQVAFYSHNVKVGECTDAMELPMLANTAPYNEIDCTIRACGADAIAEVLEVR